MAKAYIRLRTLYTNFWASCRPYFAPLTVYSNELYICHFKDKFLANLVVFFFAHIRRVTTYTHTFQSSIIIALCGFVQILNMLKYLLYVLFILMANYCQFLNKLKGHYNFILFYLSSCIKFLKNIDLSCIFIFVFSS